MAQVTLNKPPQGEQVVVLNEEKAPIHCTFSAQQAEISHQGADIVFTFADGSTIIVRNYYRKASNQEADGEAENPDAPVTLPPIIMNGETVPAPPLPLSQQAEEDSESPQHTENATANPADSPSPVANTQQNNAQNPVQNSQQSPVQNSSSSPAPNTSSANASQAIEGGRFYDYNTNDLLDGINRLPGLDLPWGSKFHESNTLPGGIEDDDSGSSIPPPPNVLPTFSAESASISVREAGVKMPEGGGDGNTPFPGDASVSGKVSATDADGDSLSYGLLQQGQVVQNLSTPYGTVSINPDGTYTYTLDNDAEAINSLKQGELTTDSFTVIVNDGRGGRAEKIVSVNIEGSNDKPEISFVEGDGIHSLTARDNDLIQTGSSLTVTDVDNDGAFQGITGGKSNQSFSVADNNGNTGTSGPNGGATITTAYGTLTINADGTYSYVIDKGGTGITNMGNGADYADTFTVTVTDLHGSTSSTTVTINIHKGNEGPIVTSTNTVALIEAGLMEGGNTELPGTFEASGQVTATDVEGDNLSFTAAVPSGSSGYSIDVDSATGSQTIHTPYGELLFHQDGTYIYTLDNTKTSLNALKTGEVATETFPVTVDDGHGGTVTTNVTVTITGTNDAPVLSFGSGSTGIHTGDKGLTDAATGSSSLTATGKLDVADPDSDGSTGQTIDGKPSQNFSITDQDTSLAGTQGSDGSVSITTEYGTLTINKDGTYTYKVNTASDEVIALGTSTSHTETFIVQVKDAHGAVSNTETITVEIKGKDDPPKISGAAGTHDVTDDGVLANTNTNDGGKLTTGGTLTAEHTDNDASNDITFGLSSTVTITGGNLGNVSLTDDGKTLTTAYGTLTLTPTGQTDGKFGCDYQFALTENANIVNALPNGKTLTLKFAVQVTDDSGTRTEDVSVTITGTNDRPSITSMDTSMAVEEDGVTKTGGKVTANDVDTDDSLTYNIVDTDTSTSDKVQILQGEYGRLEIRPDGSYTYYLDNSKAQSLAQGQTGKDSFTVRVTDKLGAYIEQELDIPITGGDDKPKLGNLANSVTEDNGGHDGVAVENPGIINGKVSVADVDKWDMDPTQGGFQKFTLSDAGFTTNDDGSFTVTGKYGTLTLRADGTYDYVLDKNRSLTIQELNVEDKLTDSFNISVLTGHTGFDGSSADGKLTITINGSNDNPVVTAKTEGYYDLTINKDGTLAPVEKGQLEISDVDDIVTTDPSGGPITSQNHTFYFLGGKDGKSELQSMAGTFGVLTVNQFTGEYTYTLNQYADGLSAGGKETFTVWVKDAHGGTTSQEINVDVGALTNPPTGPGPNYTLTGGNLGVTEDAFAIGTTNVQDAATATVSPDPTDPSNTPFGFVGAVGKFTQTVTGKYGTITIDNNGNYTYTLNNSLSEVQALRKGETLADETFMLWGSNSSTITVTITGSNDKPTLSFAEGSGSLSLTQIDKTESKDLGKVVASDVDTNDTHTFWLDAGCTQKTVYYKFTLDADGKITGFTIISTAEGAHYSVSVDDNGLYTLTYLANGLHLTKDDTQNVTFDVYVKDDSGATDGSAVSDKITVSATINGTNTAPTWGTLNGKTVTEDDFTSGGGNITAAGNFLTDGGVTDDTGKAGLFFSINGTTSLFKGKYGTLLITDATTGEYVYTLDNSLDAVQQLGANASLTDEIFTIVMKDKHGGETKTEFTITVNGTNDAPTLDALTALHVTATANSNETTETDSPTAKATDKDSGDTLTYSFSAKDGSTDYTNYGTFEIDPTTGKYTFILDNSKDAVKALTDSETKELLFTITVRDKEGATASQDVTVSIKGENDAPELTLTPEASIPTITEGASEATKLGQASYIDADDNTGHRYGIQITGNDSIQYVTAGAGADEEVSVSTQYGTLTISSDGTYSYKPHSDIADFHAGSTHIDKFTISVVDGHGAATSQDITVNLTGKDNATDTVTFAALFDDSGSLDALLSVPNMLEHQNDVESPLYQNGADTINIAEMAKLLVSEAWADSGIQGSGAEYAINYDVPAPDGIPVHPAVESGAQEQAQHSMIVAVLTETGGL